MVQTEHTPAATSWAKRTFYRHSWPLGAHLALYACASLIPVLLIIYYLLAHAAVRERELYLQKAELVARDISLRVDREMDRALAVVKTLATSPALKIGDLAQFHQQSREAAQYLNAVVALRDERGQQISNTAVAFGAPLPVSADPIRDLDHASLGAQRYEISGLVRGTLLNSYLVLVTVPVTGANDRQWFLNIAIAPDRFGDLAARVMPEGWIAAVVDATGHVIARSRDPERFVGTSSNRAFLETATGGSGHWQGLTLEGIPIVGAYFRSQLTSWRVAVAVPQTILAVPAEHAITSLVGLSFASIVLSGLLSWVFSHHISSAVLALVARARQAGAGLAISRPNTSIDEINDVSAALVSAAEELERRARASRSAEALARRNEERLHLVQETAGIGTLDCDVRGQEVTCSPRFYAMFGLQPGQPLSRATFLALVHPDDRPRIKDTVAQLMATGGGFEDEFRILIDGAEERWIQTRGMVTTEHGTPVRVVGAAIDITRLKLSEAALASSEKRFRSTFDNAAVGVAHVSLTGQWLEVNERLCQILGYTRAELQSMTFQDITHADDLSVDLAQVDQILAGAIDKFSLEKRYRRKDGAFVWVSITVSLQRDDAGRPEYFITVTRDIGSRIAAQQEVADRLREIEALYDNAPIGLTVLDREFRFVRINHALAEMNSLAPEDHIGRVAWGIVPSLRDRIEPVIQEVLETGRTLEIELSGETPAKPGVVRYWQDKFYPLVVGDGRTIGVGITVEEITERKRSEEHLRFVMRELSHRSKNLLALVQAMASQTARSAADMADFRERFGQRLRGLAASHDLLVTQNWQGVSVEELVRRQLAPFIDVTSPRIRIDGPAFMLKAESAQTLGLALHELGTNAVKHGALRDPEGRIEVSWRTVRHGDDEDVFEMRWVEWGDRPIAPPMHTGFGNSVIERMIASTLGGSVEIAYPASGFQWHIAVPATVIAK